jgi:hypothetical protein
MKTLAYYTAVLIVPEKIILQAPNSFDNFMKSKLTCFSELNQRVLQVVSDKN